MSKQNHKLTADKLYEQFPLFRLEAIRHLDQLNMVEIVYDMCSKYPQVKAAFWQALDKGYKIIDYSYMIRPTFNWRRATILWESNPDAPFRSPRGWTYQSNFDDFTMDYKNVARVAYSFEVEDDLGFLVDELTFVLVPSPSLEKVAREKQKELDALRATQALYADIKEKEEEIRKEYNEKQQKHL